MCVTGHSLYPIHRCRRRQTRGKLHVPVTQYTQCQSLTVTHHTAAAADDCHCTIKACRRNKAQPMPDAAGGFANVHMQHRLMPDNPTYSNHIMGWNPRTGERARQGAPVCKQARQGAPVCKQALNTTAKPATSKRRTQTLIPQHRYCKRSAAIVH
jgi:hypothetical protein